MKKFSPKVYLLAITLGLAAILFAHAEPFPIGINQIERNPMDFISQAFWKESPSSGETAKALFGTDASGATAYTQNRSGYIAGDCSRSNMNVYHVFPDHFDDSTNPTIENNTIFVLESGNYSYLWDPFQYLSGACIALVASGNVSLDWSLIPINNPENIIIDNIANPEIGVSTKTYTNTGNEEVILKSNVAYTWYYTIIWNITNQITGIIADTTGYINIALDPGEGDKKIDVIFGTGNTVLMHFTKHIILDTTAPIFTGTSQSGAIVISGWVYNTGVSFTFSDVNLSGATLDGNPYTGGTLITGEKSYSFVVTDLAGNSTWINFAIDYTTPTFTRIMQNGTVLGRNKFYFNTGVFFVFNDTNLSGATLNGNLYTGTIISWENAYIFNVMDKAWNNTGVSFYIDNTLPNCTPTSPLSGSTVISGSLALDWNCIDNYWLTGLSIIINDSGNNLVYSGKLATTGTSFIYTGSSNTYNWKVIATDFAGNDSNMSFQKITYIKPILVTSQNPGILYLGKYYVNTGNISIAFSGNLPFQYQFTGDTVTTGKYFYTNWTVNRNIILSSGDWVKNIMMSYRSGSQSGWMVGPTLFYVDTVAPSISGTYPTANLKTNQTTINFQRTGTDTWGISGYVLKLDNNVIYSGTATNFSATNINTGSHTWTIQAIDHAGNSTTNTLQALTVDNSYPTIIGVTNNGYYSTGVTPILSQATGLLNGNVYVSHMPITWDALYNLVVTNDVGNTTSVTFTIDTTKPVISPISPANGTTLTTSNNMTFMRNGQDTNMSGYLFTLSNTGGYNTNRQLVEQSFYIWNIPNGTYVWTVTAFDKAGNSNTISQTLIVNLALSGTVGLTWKITNNNIEYTNTTFGIQFTSNKNGTISIAGDLLSGGIMDNIIGWIGKAFTVIPTAWDGVKTFTAQIMTGNETVVKTVTGYLDTTAPSTPTFSGQPTNYSGTCLIGWATSSDAWVGISDYTFAVLSGSTVLKTGISTITGMNIANMEIGSTGNYTLYVAARDKLGNTSTSGSFTFGYVGIEDLTVDIFSITRVTNASLNTKYKSNSITVSGITTGSRVLASVDNWSLIVNGVDVGVNQYVKLGDQVQIALYSSQEENDMTAWKLTIWDQSSIFRVVTNLNGNSWSLDNNYTISTLTNTQKLHVSLIYNTLSSLYSSSQQTDFMVSLKSLVKSKIVTMTNNNENVANIETMEYLFNLINDDFAGSSSTSSSSSYIAPNGKSYTIQYSNNGYTSSTFSVVRYFSSLTDIKSYIDQKNPKSVYVGGDYAIDQSRTTSTYIAPSGKSYVFFKTTDGRYGSNNFASAKIFKNLADMKHHINVNNPKN